MRIFATIRWLCSLSLALLCVLGGPSAAGADATASLNHVRETIAGFAASKRFIGSRLGDFGGDSRTDLFRWDPDSGATYVWTTGVDKIDLPDNFSPQSEFWLIHNEVFVGTIKIRHNLGNSILKELGGHIGYFIRPSKRKMGYGKIILRLGLVKAKELNLNEVLITCDINNIGSKKIIESNGGVFEKNVLNNGSDGGFRSRYFINLM